MKILFLYSSPIYKFNLKNLYSYFKLHNHTIDCIENIEEIPKRDIKKYNLIISNQAWWNLEYEIGQQALKLKIPHITIEHGLPMFYQSNRQYYRRTIGNADVKLLWSKYNFDMMKIYKCPSEKLFITGYPRFDNLLKYKSITNSKPKILFLSTWKISGDIKTVWKKVVEQAKILNFDLLVKPHPMEEKRGSFLDPQSIPDSVNIIHENNLFKYIAEADLVITSPTSTLIPIFYYKKPVFSYYPLFMKNYFKGMYRFYRKFKIPHSNLVQKFDLEKLLALQVDKELYNQYFKYTSYKDDGNNTKRVYNFCLKFVDEYERKN